jgi:hypothetical protein
MNIRGNKFYRPKCGANMSLALLANRRLPYYWRRLSFVKRKELVLRPWLKGRVPLNK